MSKKRIDETMTQARQAREKKAREQAETEATVELLVTKDGIQKLEGDAATDPKPTVAEYLESEGHPEAAAVAAPARARRRRAPSPRARRRGASRSCPTPRLSRPRKTWWCSRCALTTAERDAIHKAAGPGKASKFVRQVAIAAARGDVDAVQRLIDARVK